MKKLLLWLLCLTWAGSALAQRPTVGTNAAPGGGTPPGRWKEHMDSVFQYVNRTPVTTGLLADYGFALLNYKNYAGTALHDSNYADLGNWRLLYAAMQASTFNSNATLLPLPTANTRIATAEQAGPVVMATLLARYERLKPTAASQNLVYASNGRLYDTPGRSQSPYETQTLVAVAPSRLGGSSSTVQFRFPATLLFTNAAPAINTIEFDAGDGGGY